MERFHLIFRVFPKTFRNFAHINNNKEINGHMLLKFKTIIMSKKLLYPVKYTILILNKHLKHEKSKTIKALFTYFIFLLVLEGWGLNKEVKFKVRSIDNSF